MVPTVFDGMTTADGAADDALDDETLMLRVGKGDREAFGLLVGRHLGRGLAVVHGFDGLKAEAEDIVQEAFSRVWVKAPAWQPPPADASLADRRAMAQARFSTWFHRIVVNLCIDRQRRCGFRNVGLDAVAEPVDDRADQAGSMIADQRDGLVRRAVAGLPERQRLAVTLCALDGYSNAEAAEVMGLGIKALEALLVRGRRSLREALTPLLEEGAL